MARRRSRPAGERAKRSGGGSAGPARALAWVQEHPRAGLSSLGRMWRNPVASALTIAVIAIALALPGALWMLLKNAERATGGWDSGARISVYMEPGLDPGRVRAAGDRIAARSDVVVTERISAEQALAEFRALSGFEQALQALDRNPLPAVVVVEPAGIRERSPERLEGLTRSLERIDGVDRAQLDLEWVERLYALLDLIERAVTAVGGLLGLGVLLIVGNTIRLDILNRREEIEVTKLIGGSDAFIRRPLLYSGAWYGLLAGVLAWVVLAVGRGLLAGPAERLAAAYGSAFRLEGLSGAESVALLVFGTGLGLLGAWIAVGRHLRSIEPG